MNSAANGPTIGSGKAVAGGFAGGVVTVGVWIVSLFGLDVPGEVAAAVTTIVGTVIVYFVPARVRQE